LTWRRSPVQIRASPSLSFQQHLVSRTSPDVKSPKGLFQESGRPIAVYIPIIPIYKQVDKMDSNRLFSKELIFGLFLGILVTGTMVVVFLPAVLQSGAAPAGNFGYSAGQTPAKITSLEIASPMGGDGDGDAGMGGDGDGDADVGGDGDADIGSTTMTTPAPTTTTAATSCPTSINHGFHCEGNRLVGEICDVSPAGIVNCRVALPVDCFWPSPKCCEFASGSATICGISIKGNGAFCKPFFLSDSMCTNL
jgi:hypothetical protein